MLSIQLFWMHVNELACLIMDIVCCAIILLNISNDTNIFQIVNDNVIYCIIFVLHPRDIKYNQKNDFDTPLGIDILAMDDLIQLE